MMLGRSVLLAAAVAVAAAGTALAATPWLDSATVSKCLGYGGMSRPAGTLHTKQLIAGLDITVQQRRRLQARLATLQSDGTWPTGPTSAAFAGAGAVQARGLNGLGLTTAQRHEIQRRIAAQVAAIRAAAAARPPAGSPCPPFTNSQQVIDYVHETLVYNGFRPSTTLTLETNRYIKISGVRDGVPTDGAVVRTGVRQIAVRVWPADYPKPVTTATFDLAFAA